MVAHSYEGIHTIKNDIARKKWHWKSILLYRKMFKILLSEKKKTGYKT